MAFGGGLDDDDEVMSEINMTPLVDVMLVLLIIFILTVPVLTHTVNIDLPQANNAPNDVTPQTIALTVTADAAIHWNDEVISGEVLANRLQSVAAVRPQPEIQLRGDKAVAYQHVIAVMAAAQQAGIEKLGFVTEPIPQ
ncbi:ExbD/TolR family protein [Ketobacter alkanivorans]|uniref:Biopolymer transporter ExbD n=1 Tax=Ketobacter alkanivorans TaxID=1917421 RepID=A0A2K9LFJ5_9GAMM|nr:biopolymer transporter ExbD [Ketobacter alkanivorans]AUM10997.1 biopolymer transporter ExbD [Ketobacter alkanivorans]